MMVRSIFGLFAESPFVPLQELAEKVQECAEHVPELFDALFDGDYTKVRATAEEISHLEHEADVAKDKIRDRLPKTIFLPVDRRDLLEIISLLDAVADYSEDVGQLLTLRELEAHEEMEAPVRKLLRRVVKVVDQSSEVVGELDVLVEVGFSGPEAERVRDMIDELNRLEHEADKVQDELARTLFSLEDELRPGSLFLWNKIINKVGDIANRSEKVGNRLRLFMAEA
ncbi:MAG: TIGR00153 family protein [Bradymonadaceae bacterium]